jgi:hypothetical protein
MEQMDDDHDDGDGHDGDQALNLEKKKEKNKMVQGKGIFDRSILFCHLLMVVNKHYKPSI